ncbi:helix-turn-helix domain-containing protein [Staphylococcus arlettae]|uniref:helix-turn-helix domain-containing protein n=1 Tax=Staphylococcus arlettae TaxID=29378 RepID=UPI0021D1B701|nr:helix-turn-helix transcriptional regulator [Staphylococcus arlettae]UXU53750.1 helix-turn-helix domain-containing protein [Staphylococcus arlettae]
METLRKEKRLSRYRLAKLTNLKQSTLRTIETRSENPGFLTIKKICTALEVDLNEVEELK